MDKIIELHKKAALNFEDAAKHHHEAAKHHEATKHEAAHEHTVKAHGHSVIARESEKEILKHHAAKK